MKKEQSVKRQISELDQKEIEQISFAGLYFLGVGFMWQLMWQLNKVVDYHVMLRISESAFRWASIVIVAFIITYLAGYMVHLETKKHIDSKGLLIKYFIGLLLGYIVGKILTGTI